MEKRKRRALDRLDGEGVREVLLTRGWKVIEKRMRETVELKTRELVNPHGEVQTALLRGEIAGLTTALKIPGILVSESTKESSDELRKRPEED